MKEDFLHYIWQFQKFDFSNIKTVQGESLTILNSGQYLQKAGPDFFNAQIIIGNQKWAGNVEIHLKSSDWYVHHHETDSNYESVILHVVWEHDTEVFRKDNSEIPVLELKNYIPKNIIENYNALAVAKSWIYCEKEIQNIDDFVLKNWQEKLFFERLQRKVEPIQNLLSETENDWEAVLFCLLAKNFGLNTNGEILMKVAKSIPFSIIRKESAVLENSEALLFGRSGLLEKEHEDTYFKDLKFRWIYIQEKYKLKKIIVEPIQFFKHRPDNFPTIRLAQLAQLYFSRHNLFSQVLEAKSVSDFYKIFNVQVSEYWKTHYQFDKESPKKRKSLTNSFIDLLLINTIIPLKFIYANSLGKDVSEDLIDLLNEIQAEKNVIIEKFNNFGIESKSAFETQSLLQLKNEYCNQKRCMKCAIGLELLKT
ncbi:DUF2851 family protein [uncultured Flavobacterium sp.]|uniref:DUF2851 family protein n=1 Tax=uncultured Flavobacterium sp. TaxID=165435 RepID=UPI0025EC027A|nr:DUF2851 family protein [uncultured Flavobacterium sp.]